MCGMSIQKGHTQAMEDKRGSQQILNSSKPGDAVFIDQLTIITPGLIGQVTWFLMHERYSYATVFLDHFSDLPYIVFHKAAGSVHKYDNLASINQSGRPRARQLHTWQHAWEHNYRDVLRGCGQRTVANMKTMTLLDIQKGKMRTVRQCLVKYRTINPWKNHPEDNQNMIRVFIIGATCSWVST